MIDARVSTGTAPDEQTEMRYPTRESEFDHRRLQVPALPPARSIAQPLKPEWQQEGDQLRAQRLKHVDRARRYSSFHLIEQPIDAFWSAGASPVVAIARMASTSSRGAPARGGVVRPSSSRPRYLSLRSAL